MSVSSEVKVAHAIGLVLGRTATSISSTRYLFSACFRPFSAGRSICPVLLRGSYSLALSPQPRKHSIDSVPLARQLLPIPSGVRGGRKEAATGSVSVLEMLARPRDRIPSRFKIRLRQQHPFTAGPLSPEKPTIHVCSTWREPIRPGVCENMPRRK